MHAITRFLLDNDGATAVEYALIIALILAVLIFSIIPLGQNCNESLADFDSTW